MKKLVSMPERKPLTNLYKEVKKDEKDPLVNEEDVMICEYCGVEINKHQKICPNSQAVLN